MLVQFSVRNYGPFREWATLDLRSVPINGPEGNFAGESPRDGKILSSILIFGANASGKSFLIEALFSLVRIVKDIRGPQERIPNYIPFYFRKDARSSPVEMRVRLLIDDITYDYEIAYNETAIVRESLHHYPKGRKAAVFVRDETGFKKAKKTFSSKTAPASAYLTVSSSYNDEICGIVINELRRIIFLDSNLGSLREQSCDFVCGTPERKGLMVKALSIADFGITDFRSQNQEIQWSAVEKDVPPSVMEKMDRSKPFIHKDIDLKHDLKEYDVDDDDLYLPLEEESAGTQSMFGLMGPITDALLNGRIVVIDEFGTRLHPILSRWIVEQFKGSSNPNGAQLIANTHDLQLMDVSDLVRRDQIWFTNKDRRTGMSELYSLTDFKDLRSNTNILKSYLFGRFDAIPEVDSRGVLR